VIGCYLQYYEVIGVSIILNVHAAVEGESDDTKVSLYEEIELVFYQFQHKNFIRRFQCKSREIRYFQTKNR